MNSEAAISPIDGRYWKDVEELSPFFSEMALMKYRIRVEVEYLIALGQEKGIPKLSLFSNSQQQKLRSFYLNFTARDFQTIKRIERTTLHDIKAVENFLRKKLDTVKMREYQEWIHFALTSEDINNLTYALMWKGAVKKVYLPSLNKLHFQLKRLAKRYHNTAMLAMTHGQPATPTSLGKEIAVFTNRIKRQLEQLRQHRIQGKLSGATGTWSAHVVCYPKVNWARFSRRFVSSLGLEPNLINTQVESNDSLAESYHNAIRINTILIDLCRDMWLYISRGIFQQKVKSGEIGSSTMPHKVNPIHFENAEGNLGIANAVLSHLAHTLPVSRLQRDLSGSTTIRNQGVPLAHSLLACKNIQRGLNRLTINRKVMNDELNSYWEVIAEAIQTVLRKSGDHKAYDRLRMLTRGQKITQESIQSFIQQLDLPQEEKQTLLDLTPGTYTGLASKIVKEL